jgi:acetyltransferase-like isoleucine patch superfamily enzyme
MKNNFFSKISMRLHQLGKVAKQERRSIVLFKLIGWVIYVIQGKFLAFMVGWKNSYLGWGSRIIGTRLISVGDSLSVGRYAWIEVLVKAGDLVLYPVIQIGERFHASERLHISAINRISIGDDCLFGSCVYVSDHNHGSYSGEAQSSPDTPPVLRNLISGGPVLIGSNVWVGDNVTILGPIRIGDGVVVGANSVVTHDIPDNVVVGGVPARILKEYNSVSKKWEALHR